MTAPNPQPSLILCELADAGLPGLESFSPFCLKAHRGLKAAGLSYTRRLASNPAAHRRYNPTGQVPVLLIGDEVVADSTTILHRIEAMGPVSLNPDPDPAIRAEAWLWEELADTSLNGFLVAARWADERNWPAVREAYFAGMPRPLRALIPARLRAHVVKGLVARDIWRAGPQACWDRFESVLDQLEARVHPQGYWVGQALSVADIALFAQLHSLRSPLTPWQAGQIGHRRNLSNYLDRIHAATWEQARAAA